jgi:lysozyme
MSAVDYALPQLETDEGFRAFAYTDTTGHQTIGYGFNLAAGMSEPEARNLLAFMVADLDETLETHSWYAACNDTRKSALLNMAYNMGISGLLQFKDMIAAITAQNWAEAKAQCLNSSAARLLPTRYGRIADLLLTGTPSGD